MTFEQTVSMKSLDQYLIAHPISAPDVCTVPQVVAGQRERQQTVISNITIQLLR